MIRRLFSNVFAGLSRRTERKAMSKTLELLELYEQVRQEMGAEGERIKIIRPSTEERGPQVTCFQVSFPSETIYAEFIRRVRDRRAGKTCFTCGYSLTANTSGVCPECGTPVARMQETPA